jgi:multidrug efflux pump subunit AcrA (membrane-fusion protein)
MKRWKIALIVIIVLAAAGGGFGYFRYRNQAEAGTAGPGSGPQVVEVKRGSIEVMVDASASLTMPTQAQLSFDIGTQRTGTLKVLNVEAGDSVKAGQVLAQLDTASLERDVAEAERRLRTAQISLEKLLEPPDAEDILEAEADVESAKLSWEYAEAIHVAEGAYPEGLHKKGQLASAHAALITAENRLVDLLEEPDPLDVELEQIEVAGAQSSLDEAKEQLLEASIIAPFDGIVVEVAAEAGETVQANTTIIHMVDPTKLEVEALVNEVDIAKVREGQEVSLTFDALGRRSLAGQVSYVSLTGIAEAGVVDYRVIMTVEPPRGTQLREGLTGSATILAEQRENILLVPNRAVSRRRRDRLVQVLVDGIPQERIIKVGVSDEQYTEVVEGLAEGESVIVPSSST